jgi:Subtilase family
MKRNGFLKNGLPSWIIPLTIFLMLVTLISSCRRKEISYVTYLTTGYPEGNLSKWVDWNVLFKPGTDSATRARYMNYLAYYVDSTLIAYNTLTGKTLAVYTRPYFTCPCDTLLVNFNAIGLAGSGLPANPKPPCCGAGGSGDIVDLQNVNNSFVIDSVTQMDQKLDTSLVYLKPSNIDTAKTLAVMDTGLDSAKFQNNFAGLLWSDPSKPTIRNFLSYENFRNLDYYADDDPHKHGTAVTTIALKAAESYNVPDPHKPRVMVLKVLDSNRMGSTFSVSCALSYAFQNHATLINASLGYYSTGDIDSVLKRYVDLCKRAQPNPIPILAAAGNVMGMHYPPLCSPPPVSTGNELSSKAHRLFYPACFSSEENSNIITVTGLQTNVTSCIYQNYSEEYVIIGVLTNPSNSKCCAFDALNRYYEGSSFATPFVSGKLMGCLLSQTSSTTQQNCLDVIAPLPSSVPSAPATKKGRYIPYISP